MINYSQSDLIIHKQPHKERGVTRPTKPCGYIGMMTTSPRDICSWVLAVSANPQIVMGNTLLSELSPVPALFSVWQPCWCHWWTTAAPSPSAHSSSSPPTSLCGGSTPRNVDPALLHPGNTSLTTSSARVSRVGRNAGASGGCASYNGKGGKFKSVCVRTVYVRLVFSVEWVIEFPS